MLVFLSGIGAAGARLTSDDDSGANGTTAPGSSTSIPLTSTTLAGSIPGPVDAGASTTSPAGPTASPTTTVAPDGTNPPANPDELANTGSYEWIQWVGFGLLIVPLALRRLLASTRASRNN